jgi:hypothetical protein
MKVGIPKAENQTTVVASSCSSSASPVSLGMQACSSRTESLPNSEHQTPGSFSTTGLLEMQQQGTGPVKSQALPIIWEEDYDFAEWEKTLIWRELLQGHDIPNDEAALKALLPREVARALDDIAAAKSIFREARAAWSDAMESWMPRRTERWVPLTPAALKALRAWQAILLDLRVWSRPGIDLTVSRPWKQIREVLGAWGEESPGEFEAWKEACRQDTVMKTWRAAYSEIVNLRERVLKIEVSPAVKVGSGWKADMDLKLLKDLNPLLLGKQDDVFWRAVNIRQQFRDAEMSLPFFPTKLIHE